MPTPAAPPRRGTTGASTRLPRIRATVQLPNIAPGKRFSLPRPVGSADALLLARLAQACAAEGRLLAIVTAITAVVVRRMVSQLKQAGLVSAVQTNRGLRLCKSAREISFWDVLQAVDAEHELFAIHSGSNVQCDIGCQIETVLSQMYASLEQVWRQQLQAQSLQDALDSLQ